MEHCSTLSQVLQVLSTVFLAPKCPNSCGPSYPTLLEALATPGTAWNNDHGDMIIVASSKLESSGPTLSRPYHTPEGFNMYFYVTSFICESHAGKSHLNRIMKIVRLRRPLPVFFL